MHAALSVPRVHHPKNHILGRFDVEKCMVVVDRPKGPHFKTIGKATGLKVWLLPEEALYLLERGSLDIRWPNSIEGQVNNKDNEGNDDQAIVDIHSDEEEGIPMSLQGAYTAFLGMQPSESAKLTLEKYIVYASLKRLGYIVLRAKEWDGIVQEIHVPERETSVPPSAASTTRPGLLSKLLDMLLGSRYPKGPQTDSPHGSMVRPGIYRSYGMSLLSKFMLPLVMHLLTNFTKDDIYKLLQLNLSGKPSHAYPKPADPWTMTYDVYKPSTNFRKSDPGPPDFRICVLDGRETSVPSLLQLTYLMVQAGPSPPRLNAQLYNRLKHGHSHVILAIVDQGVVSYMRVSEAQFSEERIYEWRRRGGGRGGKRGGRRGRGRRGGR